ncbi:hypothetical protein [Marinoscillum sp. MHG1-6]|uniref:hypothetical protein n=1 Tax=Marinoscillum sp. MHG1-6 TaxID=2959627 RepID=UPI0021581B78|nr:hypothetical protein [Marinoscillum sp. MHG1-6]
MKKTAIFIAVLFTALGSFAFTTKDILASDTVIIELSAGSKIIIYSDNREELKGLERYDINQMIRDINEALESKKIQKIELTDENGQSYSKDTTIIIGDGQAKTSIKIGNMELLIDADEWEEDEEDHNFFWDDFDKEDDNDNRRTSNSFNVDIGLNNWMAGGKFPDADNSPFTVKPFGSWYIGLNSSYSTWVTGPLYLDWGFGVSWNNYKLQDSDYIFTKGANEIELQPTPAEYQTIKSRLSVPYVNVNFVPVINLTNGQRPHSKWKDGFNFDRDEYKNQGLRFGLGGYAGYRIGGNSKLKYKVNGNKQKDKTSDHFYLQNFRYGIRAQFGFKGLDIFATYDLNEVFSQGHGPVNLGGLHAMSFGITL